MSCSVCAGYDSFSCPCCGEEKTMIDCPDCHGTGEGDYKVFDILDRVVLNVPKSAYELAAEDEDTADALKQRFCRYSCTCLTCKGEGQILE